MLDFRGCFLEILRYFCCAVAVLMAFEVQAENGVATFDFDQSFSKALSLSKKSGLDVVSEWKDEPLKLSLTTILLTKPPSSRYKDHRVKILKTKLHDVTRRKLKYRFFKGSKGNKETIFLISGLGSGSKSRVANYLAGRFQYLQGEMGIPVSNVVILPNALHKNFLRSSSSLGYSGLPTVEAIDMYQSFGKILEDINKKYNLGIKKISLAGFSHGGILSAFIKYIDSREDFQIVDRVLLINPPVSMFYGTKVLDSYLGQRESIRLLRKVKAAVSVLNAVVFRKKFSYKQVAALLKNIEDLNEKDLEYIIGFSMRGKLTQGLLVSQDFFDLGILPPKAPEGFWGVERFYNNNYKQKRRVAAGEYDYIGYGEIFLVPYLEKMWGNIRVNLDWVAGQASLYPLEDFFEKEKDIHLIHNYDDFLLREGDVDWLKRVFKNRATILSWGGHLGNIWSKEVSFFIRNWLAH